MEETNELIRIFADIHDKESMKKFFMEIFTPNERHDLTMRWKLMKLLEQGVPQRKIASDLGISLCKITRGSKIVQNPNSVSYQIIKKNKHP
jgi:TrpR family trp operon transcriptional repressor